MLWVMPFWSNEPAHVLPKTSSVIALCGAGVIQYRKAEDGDTRRCAMCRNLDREWIGDWEADLLDRGIKKIGRNAAMDAIPLAERLAAGEQPKLHHVAEALQYVSQGGPEATLSHMMARHHEHAANYGFDPDDPYHYPVLLERVAALLEE